MDEIQEISPELFIWELYCSDMLAMLDSYDALERFAIGYCDGGRLPVRPRSDLIGLMVEFPDGEKMWAHITPDMLASLQKRRSRAHESEASHG